MPNYECNTSISEARKSLLTKECCIIIAISITLTILIIAVYITGVYNNY